MLHTQLRVLHITYITCQTDPNAHKWVETRYYINKSGLRDNEPFRFMTILAHISTR